MHLCRIASVVLVSIAIAACGGDGKDVKEPNGGEETAAGEGEGEGESAKSGGDSEGGDAQEDESGIPTKCAKTEGDVCLPNSDFVKKLCNGDFPTVAMKMFSNGTPWTRAYLTHETNAWNASGGGSSNEKLAPDEEVIVLRFRKPASGGIQVSGASGGYDAMRWDGMCVTLDGSELRFDAPSKPKNARLIWNRIEMDTRDALKKDEVVRKAYIAYKQECKGVTVGKVSKKCATLDGELSVVIANHVRESGAALPTPKKLPE